MSNSVTPNESAQSWINVQTHNRETGEPMRQSEIRIAHKIWARDPDVGLRQQMKDIIASWRGGRWVE